MAPLLWSLDPVLCFVFFSVIAVPRHVSPDNRQRSYLSWHLSRFANLQFVEYELFDGFVIRAFSCRTPVLEIKTQFQRYAHTHRMNIGTLKVISITCFRRFCFGFVFFFLTFFEPKVHLCDRCKNVNTKYEGFVSGFAESDDTHADGHGNNNNEKKKKEFTQKRGINTKEYSRTISVAARARAHHQSFASVFLFVDDIVVDLFFFHSSPFSLLLLFHIYFLVDVAAASDAAWSCLLSMISFLFYCVLFFCYSFCVALHPKESLKKKLCVCVECEQQQASPSETEMMWIVESFCWKEPEENVTHSQSYFNGNCSQDCLYRFFLFLR